MIGHKYVRYEFEGPFFPERGAHAEERFTARCPLEDRQSVSDVTGQVMQRSR